MAAKQGLKTKLAMVVGVVPVGMAIFAGLALYGVLAPVSVRIGFVVVFFLSLLILGWVYRIASRMVHPFEELIGRVRDIGRGRLEKIDERHFDSNETLILARTINEMTESLQNQVRETSRIMGDFLAESRELEAAMATLSSSSSEQAAAVAQTASTVTEMERAALNAAENANQIADAAEKTAETSDRGRNAVETTNQIILRIKDDSKEMSTKSKNLLTSIEEVGNIIGFVNGIAEQSKILAVNASIEAAKAGEYGAGFAVVAQEVRDLAQQSKEATLQTTETLTGIRKAIENIVITAQSGEIRTEDSVEMIGNAGAIVHDLSKAIRENSQFANFIATNVGQQTMGLNQIATAIEQINRTAQENQSINRSMERSVKNMTESVARLSKLLETRRES